MNHDVPPKVTVIIPVLNAAGILENCLRSLARQDYPAAAVEILVVDGGSTDNTREIAKRYHATLLDNPQRVAESGKRLAMEHAHGDYIFFLDADNEVSHPDFLSLAVQAMEKCPRALGVESYYPANDRMGSFCAYLTATLHISDPVSWMMSATPVRSSSDGTVEVWRFPENSLAYPLGANGFVLRRSDLVSVGAKDYFEDTVMVLKLAQSGRREWLRLQGRGVHHYIVSGVREFLKKRRRQTYHFLAQRRRPNQPSSWTSENPPIPGWLACLACASVIVPLWQTLRGLLRTGDTRWLWHPVACLLSVLGVAWGTLTFLLTKRDADAEARLQPTQKIEGRNR
ncbi:MAG: glycosyltransferase family 2 protein [Verrucomicrobiota bacterium]